MIKKTNSPPKIKVKFLGSEKSVQSGSGQRDSTWRFGQQDKDKPYPKSNPELPPGKSVGLPIGCQILAPNFLCSLS
jgi:hypothetical protein